MMRKVGAILAIAVGLTLAMGLVAAKDEPVKVFVDGCKVNFDPPALIRAGTTYVPLRAGAGAVGADVKWDAEARCAIITSGDRKVVIRQSQGITVGGRLLIPLRLMSESLRCDVAWDKAAKAVRITTKSAKVPPRSGST